MPLPELSGVLLVESAHGAPSSRCHCARNTGSADDPAPPADTAGAPPATRPAAIDDTTIAPRTATRQSRRVTRGPGSEIREATGLRLEAGRAATCSPIAAAHGAAGCSHARTYSASSPLASRVARTVARYCGVTQPCRSLVAASPAPRISANVSSAGRVDLTSAHVYDAAEQQLQWPLRVTLLELNEDTVATLRDDLHA